MSVIPLTVSAKIEFVIVGTNTPITRLRRAARLPAILLGMYPTWSMASSTRWRVVLATVSGALIVRETVIDDTPASWATSFMVARVIWEFGSVLRYPQSA